MGKLLIPDCITHSPKYNNCLRITGFIQTDGYSCGYAAAFTLLRYFGLPSNRQELWNDVEPCPDMGTATHNLLKAVRSRGLIMSRQRVTMKNIRAAIDNGYPILVCARLDNHSVDEAHWMVAAGYRGTDVLLLNQPSFMSLRKWWPRKKLVRRSTEPFGWVARPRG